MYIARRIYFLIFQGTVASLLTASQLHKRAERVAQMAVEQGRLSSGDNVALLFTPGMYLTDSGTTSCPGSLSLQGRRRRESLGTRLLKLLTRVRWSDQLVFSLISCGFVCSKHSANL